MVRGGLASSSLGYKYGSIPGGAVSMALRRFPDPGETWKRRFWNIVMLHFFAVECPQGL